ncbi:MAG: xanthine dehydrogenase family protein molybdopterin-binding subunit [Candidatus Binatia bacterium]
MRGTMKMVGASVRRVEDPGYLLGKGNYVADLALPGMLEVAFLRSPYAHARIRSIDVSAAKSHPGVQGVFTWDDLSDVIKPFRVLLDTTKHPSYKACDQTPLASDKVRFVGEAVVAVVAESRYVAEDALEKIVVDWEPLDALVDPERALTDRSNLVHEEWGDNVMVSVEFATPGLDEAFQGAAVVVKDRFRTNRHFALPLETRGVVAKYDRTRKELTVWQATQMPHMMRTAFADHLGHPENQIRVIAPDVGGGFGLKAHLHAEEVVTVALARKFDAPLRWLEDRRESFLASHHAKDELLDAELAVDADGTIRALRFRALSDSGAYNAPPFNSALEVAQIVWILPGPYRIRNYGARGIAVATNKPPIAAYRGVGAPTACFVMEGLLDRAARELDMDPADIRRKNMLRKEEFPYASISGLTYEVGGHHECLEKALEVSGYEAFRREQAELRKRGIYRGIGIGSYVEMTAISSVFWNEAGMDVAMYESANIKVDPNGHVTIWTGTHSHGQAHQTVFAQVASDQLGIPLERITVRLGDTNDSPYGWGAGASRGAVVGGGAVMRAAMTVAEKIKRIAGHKLEIAPDDIELVDDKAQAKGAPSKFVPIPEIARMAVYSQIAGLPPGETPGLEATYYYEPPPVTYPNATHIAVVEVDVNTGALKFLRYVIAEDVGTMINPMVLDGQAAGGVAQGLGGALLEQLVYDENGQLLTTSLMDYLVPSAVDVPFMDIAHHETPSPLTIGGFKGAGEGGVIGAFGAIGNAVNDALAPFGARVVELPLHPERIQRLARRS